MTQPSAPKTPRRRALPLLLLAASAASLAQTAPAPLAEPAAAAPSAARPSATPKPLWELGFIGVAGSQQAYPGSAQQIRPRLALPYLIYRGPVLRADQETLGLRAGRSASTEFDVGLAGAFGSRAGNSAVRRGMPDLGTLVEAGPRARIDLGPAPGDGRWRLSLPLRAVLDLSDHGAWRGLSFSPDLSWSRRSGSGWAYTASAGAVVGNARLADLFYQVTPAQANAGRPAFDARGGLIAWRGTLSASTDLTPDWRLFGYARVDSVAGAANRASPLIERSSGVSAGIGLAWTWMRSERLAAD